MNKWTEKRMQRAIVNQLFKSALMLVPNCSWTGYECDLLIIEKNLRIIDIEVKISRSDFKADAKKDKWWKSFDWQGDSPHNQERIAQYRSWEQAGRPKTKREWPKDVWKHYYAVPREIWNDDLLPFLPSQQCGVIVFWENNGNSFCSVKKNAKPCRDAKPISSVNAIDIARLAALRMWGTYNELENAHHQNQRLTEENKYLINNLQTTCKDLSV